MGVTDEVLRKKKQRKKESSGTFWSLEEWQGEKKGGKKENKERVRVRVGGGEKTKGKKNKEMSCVEDKKEGGKNVITILSQ